MLLRIRDTDGERCVTLTRRVTTLGSSEECHVKLAGAGVAPVHAVLYRDPAGYRVSLAEPDLALVVNGTRVDGHLLRVGDRVEIGDVSVEVTEPGGAAADPPENGASELDAATPLLQQLDAFSSSVLAGEPWPRPAEVLLDSLLQGTGAEHGFLLLFEGDRPRIVAARPALENAAVAAELVSDSIVQRVLGDGAAVVLDHAAEDPVYAGAPSVARLQLSSVLCLPVGTGGEIRGALYLGHRQRPGLFGPQVQALARVFCAQAALLLQSARHTESLRNTVADLQRRVDQVAERDIVARSPQMQQVLRTLERAAPSSISVLLLGETGTGKELAARFLHEASPRSGPFVALNCAAIPEALLESELFGHVRGAFTGAHEDRTGLVEQAAGGTLFLDEVGEMPTALQAKLLRVLQERQVRRVGDVSDRPVDLRVLAASNRKLEGTGLRSDLYYRLAGLELELPPLRDRTGDLELLTRLFLRRFCAEFDRGGMRLSEAAWQRLRRHDWPGNIRELENRLHRAVLMSDGTELSPEDLGFGAGEGSGIEPLAPARDRFIAAHVRRALDLCGGDRDLCARELGIGVRSLYRYLKLDGAKE
jgi:DNA-binding NtrC family response regulator